MKNVFLLGATLAIALAFMEPVAAQGPKASQGQDGTSAERQESDAGNKERQRQGCILFCV